MSMTLSSMRMATLMGRFSLSWSSASVPPACFVICATRFTEPRLQTAISVSLVFSVISVHRFDECTTPTCCCGERMLRGRNLLEQLDLAACGLLFICNVSLFERCAEQVVQVRAGCRREQRPVAVFVNALHEQVGNPV